MGEIITKKDQLKENDLMPLIIFLEYHNHKKINNKEEWDILYNFNIINECIINNNKLKIDYKIIDEKDDNNKTLDIKKIINYIMDKLPRDYFLNLFLQFFSINKDMLDLFKKFFMDEIQKVKIKEIEKKLVIKNEQLKECINKSINIDQNKDDNSNNKIESLHTLSSIKDIINEEDYSFERINSDINEQNKKNKIKDNFEKIESNDNSLLFFSSYSLKIDPNKFFDEKNLFKKFNQEEYYDGIETFKEKIARGFIEAKF